MEHIQKTLMHFSITHTDLNICVHLLNTFTFTNMPTHLHRHIISHATKIYNMNVYIYKYIYR